MKNYDYEITQKLKHNEVSVIVQDPTNKTLALIDHETGEVEEIPTERIISNPSKTVVNSESYLIVNIHGLKYLRENELITVVEKGYIMEMGEMLKSDYNALFTNNNLPHTIETLAKQLDLHYNRCTKLLRKLIKVGVCAKLSLEGKTIYVLNPFLIRNRKLISVETQNIFKTFEIQ